MHYSKRGRYWISIFTGCALFWVAAVMMIWGVMR
ncbi:hypothetical protein [Pantoea cypripedii]